jgi:flagellar hook assembly protein FlgD
MKCLHIEYALPRQTQLGITVYDVSGRNVRTLNSSTQNPGYYAVGWDGSDDGGRQVSSGVYILRFQTDDFTSTKKLVLLR